MYKYKFQARNQPDSEGCQNGGHNNTTEAHLKLCLIVSPITKLHTPFTCHSFSYSLGHVCWKMCPALPFNVGLKVFVPWISNIEQGHGDILQHSKSEQPSNWGDFKTAAVSEVKVSANLFPFLF